jgi:tetratricopeptide (TPR) repeat protein
LIFASGNAPLLSQTTPPPAPASKSAVEGKDGWDHIDQRLVFLTVELSTVESSLTATNKALKSAGYKLADLTSDADRARQRNNQMDRQGGGPVPWSQFYGTTAKDFFYHPTDDNTIHVNPVPVDQRPPQFDYIYRANEDNRAKAEAAAAAVGNKIDDLLAHRKTLQAEQLSLWCKIAFRGVASQEFSTKPIYRFDPVTTATGDIARQRVDSIKAGSEFVRNIDSAIARAQAGLDNDQKSSLDDLMSATTAARRDVDGRLLALPGIAVELGDSKSPIGQFRLATKQLQDYAENMVDAYRLSTAADVDEDPSRKSTSRGQFQRAVSSYSEALILADKSLNAAAKAWSVTFDSSRSPVQAKPETADSVPAKLEAAKSDHVAALAKARQALVTAIDARLNAAADSGDLNTVKTLQIVKTSAARDGSIAADVKDTSIIAAKSRYDQAVAASNRDLAAAYHQAIRDYTKARQYSDAQATQEELDASGLGGTTGAAGHASPGESSPSAGNVESTLKPGPLMRFSRSLPSFLVGNEFSTSGDGIILNSPVQTRATDLLAKDFVFDVECDRKEHGDPLFIGIGQGIDTRDSKTTAIKIYPAQEAGGYVALTNNDENGQEIGHLPEPGKCMVRVEKIGRSIIYSVGTVEDGKFMPQLSRAVVDIHAFNQDLQDKSAHLYIRAGKGDVLVRAGPSIGANTVANQSRKEIPMGNFPLQRILPGFLGGDMYDITPQGLVPRGIRFQSISPAFLSRDFSCDIAFSYHKDTVGWVGLGEAGTGGRPEKFVGVRIQQGNGGHQVFYLNHSEDNGKNFGEVSEDGTYIARITKQGQEVSFSIGTGEGPAFKPIASRTIGDLSSYDSELNTTNTHLFLGGNIAYNNISLSAPIVPAVAQADPAPLAETPHPAPLVATPSTPAAPATTNPLAAAVPVVTPVKNTFTGWYRIVNKQSGQCLFVEGANKKKPGGRDRPGFRKACGLPGICAQFLQRI